MHSYVGGVRCALPPKLRSGPRPMMRHKCVPIVALLQRREAIALL